MHIDYNNGKLLIHEDRNESFVKLQSCSTYNFCPEIKGGRYVVPYVALPHVIESSKRAGYSVQVSDALKEIHRSTLVIRRALDGIKNSVYPSHPLVSEILEFVREHESNGNYKLTPGQLNTVIFSILGRRVLIANEIGTGKTLCANMAIEFLTHKKLASKFLVLTPAPLVSNYVEDYKKFFGVDGILMIGKQTPEKRIIQYKHFMSNPDIHILVTNYEKCLFDFETMKLLNLNGLITDEFHYMKNFLGAKRSINFFSMLNMWKPTYRLSMSGTPIENKLFDLYPVFKMIDGGRTLGGQNFFEQNFIEFERIFVKIRLRNGQRMTKCEVKAKGFKKENVEYLKKLVRPYIIREKLDLPVGCYIHNIPIEPSKKISDAYKGIFKKELNGSARYATCRQFLCDTRREGVEDNPKIEQLENILSQTESKVIIFSFYKCSMDAISSWLDSKGIRNIVVSGDTKDDATTAVDKFKKDPTIKCLVCTDKINYGQNIQCAKIVINWEYPQKPTTLKQRVGRAHRTGQDSDVNVYNFVVMNTVEEIIMDEFNAKKEIIKRVIEHLDANEDLQSLDEQIEENVMRKFLLSGK